MNTRPFIATSAADAVTQIRAELGPEAVVVNVRPIRPAGLARLWRRPRIEVLAGVPEEVNAHRPAAARTGAEPALLDVQDSAEVCAPPPEPVTSSTGSRLFDPKPAPAGPRSTEGPWRSQTVLEAWGVSPVHAEQVLQRLRHDYGEEAPASLRSEIALTHAALTSFWRPNKSAGRGLHVFVGPPGSGKSTALAKRLTQVSLMGGASVRVWRLDVPRANPAAALDLHCEALDVPVERAWHPEAAWPEDHLFIDVPGVEAGDAAALGQLENLLGTMPGASVSLVLNAAYDLTLLQAQVRAFARLPVTDLLFTHLDEERRWSRLWNFVLGTNYPLSFLGAGQIIPGRFLRATPEALFPASFHDSDKKYFRDRALATPLLNT